MCGIAGYAGPNPLTEGQRQTGLERLRHRGPDNAGHRSFRRDGWTVELLHTRLSILDLDPRSNQPFHSGSRHLVFNGELYNYVELRRELEAAGHKFHTAGDTEVFARMLETDVNAALDRCEGMWALALYDHATGELVLARDRFGEKPLYVMRDGSGGCYFASEIKCLAALTGSRPPVNAAQVRRYLVNGYKSLFKQADTFYEGVTQIEPGTTLTIAPGGSGSARRYWTPRFVEDQDMAYDDAVEGTRDRLIEAVRLRLRADVPLAFCMSGGVDSNALVAIASLVLGHDVHGFTVVNTDARYEEWSLVEESIRILGIRHTPVRMETGGFLERLRGLVRQHDGPVTVLSYFAHWRLMEAISAGGYRVSVSGTGADELFSGYYDHHLWYLHAMSDDPDRLQEAKEEWYAHVGSWTRNPFLTDPDRFIRDPGFRDHIFLHADRFAERLTVPFDEPFAEEIYSRVPLRNRMANELFHEAVPVLLHEDDLNAMSFSIENRSPFLDRRLFEFASSIPSRHLIRRGYAKAVLRDAVRGIVPDAIVDEHRKVGFNVPIKDLLDARDPSVRATLLEDSPVFEYVRREPIEQLLNEDIGSLPNSESKFLWYFINVKMFLEEMVG